MAAPHERQPLIGRNSKFQAWMRAHPVKFGVVNGGMLTVLLLTSMGSWPLHHPTRVVVVFPATWAALALIFFLMAKGKPTQ